MPLAFQIIYHGPQDKLVPYFEEMGLQFPSDQDVADFITEFISDPQLVYTRQVRRMATEGQSPSVVPPLSTGASVRALAKQCGAHNAHKRP